MASWVRPLRSEACAWASSLCAPLAPHRSAGQVGVEDLWRERENVGEAPALKRATRLQICNVSGNICPRGTPAILLFFFFRLILLSPLKGIRSHSLAYQTRVTIGLDTGFIVCDFIKMCLDFFFPVWLFLFWVLFLLFIIQRGNTHERDL